MRLKRVDLADGFHVVRPRLLDRAQLGQSSRVSGVSAPDHDHHVNLLGHGYRGSLPLLGRIADRVIHE